MFRHISHLIRLFRGDCSGMDKSLLTAGKENGTGVYAEIFVSLILHFFLFTLVIFIFILLILLFFLYFFYTHTIYPRRFLIDKINN